MIEEVIQSKYDHLCASNEKNTNIYGAIDRLIKISSDLRKEYPDIDINVIADAAAEVAKRIARSVDIPYIPEPVESWLEAAIIRGMVESIKRC